MLKRNLMVSTAVFLSSPAAEGATMPNKTGITTVGVKATATVSISADRINAKAREFADALDADEDFVNEMNAAIDAALTLAVTPRDIYFDMLKSLGDERLASSPIPGSKIKVVMADGTEVIDNNPDEYKAAKEDGSTGQVSRYFWRDVADSTLRGKQLVEQIKTAKKLAESSNVVQGTMDKELYEAQQKTYRNNVNQAASLYHQLKAAENYPGVKVEWLWDDEEKGVLRRTPKCLSIENANAHKEYANFSVRQFLAFDFVDAMQSSKTAVGGTYARLMETRRQDGDEDAGNEQDKVNTVQDFDGVAVRLLNYLASDDNMLTLKKAIKKTGDFSDRLLLALQQIEDHIEEATVGQEARIRELKTMYASGDNRLNRRKVA